MQIATTNLETLNDKLKQSQIQQERVQDLQQAQQVKINEMKEKILQLDFKALRLGLDLGISDKQPEKVIESSPMAQSPMAAKAETRSPNSPKRTGLSSPRSSKLHSSLSMAINLNYNIYTDEMIAQRMEYLNNKSM